MVLKKVLLILFLLCFTLLADTNTTKQSLIESITNKYHTFLNGLDCFLTNYDDINKTNYKKITQNKLYMIFSIKHTKDDSFDTDLHLRANIKLPQLKDKLEISFDKQSIKSINNQNVYNDFNQRDENTRIRVGLKYYFYKKNNTQFYAKLGLKLHSPFGIYGKLGAQKSYFYHTVETIIGNNIYYYINDKNFASTTALTFLKPLSDDFTLEQGNEFFWDKNDNDNIFEHTLSLYHFINSKNRLRYQIIYTHKDDNWYGANIKLHHKTNRWLFFELIPQVLRKRENNFTTEYALAINFGITFAK
jgi:hypothetical protein